MNSSAYPASSRPGGMALLVVLSCLALLMVLVLALLSTASTETRSAATFSRSVEVRVLSDLPVNLVMAQVRDATSGLGSGRAWASQPGMIRVFGTEEDDKGAARLEGVWKLYSAREMTAGKDFDARAEGGSWSDWRSRPADFTDLNEPVAVLLPGGGIRRAHPILDPGALGRVAGFSVAASGVPGATPEQPLPMPVRWIYVLKDGRMVLPSGSQEGRAIFDDAVVTADNPLVGRIAFWTDDETCKVNINTASEGTPWDVPRTTSWTDRNYAQFVPAQNEFQRFPGHPATTCLSPVLSAFDDRFKWMDPRLDPNGQVTNTKYAPFLGEIYKLAPRINHGIDGKGDNTRGGSQSVNTSLAATFTGLPFKQDRLYASVSELFFATDRTPNASGTVTTDELTSARFFLTAHSRAPETNLFNRPRVSLWPSVAPSLPQTAKDKLLVFCATLAKRRVAWQRASLWNSATSPGSSQSHSEDFALPANQALFRYLQKLTDKPVPGFGKSTFVGKYAPDNRNQILCEIFDLQRWGVNSWCAIYDPGTSKLDAQQSYFYLPPRAYTGKNSTYIGEASAVPARITALPNGEPLPAGTTALKGYGRFPTIVEAAVVFMATEVEGKDGDGNGQPHTATSAGTNPDDEKNNLTVAAGADGWADTTSKVRAYLILQPFTPAIGMPPYTANIRYKIKGLESWLVNGQPLFHAGIHNAVNRAWRPAGAASENAHATGYTGLHAQFLKANSGDKVAGMLHEDDNYPWVSDEILIQGGVPQKDFPMNFTGGNITIELHPGFGTLAPGTTPLQTIEMTFPAVTMRVPKLACGPSGPGVNQTKYMDFNQRIKGGVLRDQLIGYGDTVRSVVVDVNGPSRGDYRYIAALAAVPSACFKPHPNYGSDAASPDTNDPMKPDSYWDEAQSLRYAFNNYQGHYGRIYARAGLSISAGQQHIWGTSGYVFDALSVTKVLKPYGLVRNVAYWQDCQPACPIRLDGAMTLDKDASGNPRPGDWDNGIGRIEDGPYINKPDEGGQEVGGPNTGGGQNQGYYSRGGFTEEKGRNYSPNRQICSGVAFGSLPTGVFSNPASATPSVPRPWQTLLFCPNPASRTTPSRLPPTEADHFGFKAPRDHLFLDLFWMPVVEPYAISEPASTAGKINMNYQMMPFLPIIRATGLHAALRSVRVSAMPSAVAWASNAGPAGASEAQKEECYKAFNYADNLKYDTNYDVNVPETLKGFESRFTAGDVFRSASEICDLFLVPKPIPGHSYINMNNRTGRALIKPSLQPSLSQLMDWWNGAPNDPDDGMKLTGDNMRESPYNQLQPRLTTRSNTFQVHYRVQCLQKARSTAPASWDEAVEKPVAELRGSTLFERYLDPNDPAIPDYVADPDAPGALDNHYRFRIIGQKHFKP